MSSYRKMDDIIWLEAEVAVDGKWKQCCLSIAEISAFHQMAFDDKATKVICANKEYIVNGSYDEFKKIMEKTVCS